MGPNKRAPTRCTPQEESLAWTATIILIVFPFLCHSRVAFKIIDSPSPVEALLGQNVTIPCVVIDGNDPEGDLNLDLTTDSVRWEKRLNGSKYIIYLLTNGNHASHRPNSEVEEKEFIRGIASLTLRDVQRSDEGEYECHVFVAGNKPQAVRTVEVSARPVVTLSSHEVAIAPGNEKSITCHVDNFYPEAVKIRWEMRNASSKSLALDKKTCTSVPIQTSDGTFNVTSMMSVKPSSALEDGDKYICIVNHRSLKTEHTESFTVIVQDPATSNHLALIIVLIILGIGIFVIALYLYLLKLKPKISDIGGIDNLVHGKRSNLSWMVSGFKPRNIEIDVYLERGVSRHDIISWKYPLPKATNSDTETGEALQRLTQDKNTRPLEVKSSCFSHSCLCSADITPDKTYDKEAELVIEVKHDAVKPSLTTRHRLDIKGDLFTCHINDPRYLIHGEETTLTCDIFKCDPGPLTITWLKGTQVIYKNGNIQDAQDERYSHTETSDVPHDGHKLRSSSSLTFKAKVNEDHGMKYICRVQYPTIEKVLQPYREVSVIAQPVVEQITSMNDNEQMKLFCHIHSFHPETIEIKWFKEDEELRTADCKLTTNKDGLYNATSILKYTPQKEDIGKTFRCRVDHQSLANPETHKWKLREHRPNGIKS